MLLDLRIMEEEMPTSAGARSEIWTPFKKVDLKLVWYDILAPLDYFFFSYMLTIKQEPENIK